ncbi:MAG: hypothetical protein ACKOD2_04405 [Ilumatobacteraceae bacterium]
MRKTFVFGALALAAVSACGGDDSLGADSANIDVSDVSVALDELGNLGELAGVPEECMTISMAMLSAIGGMSAESTDIDSLTNLPNAFDAVRELAPEELRGDVDTVRDGFQEYIDVFAEFDYDYNAILSDSEAMEKLSDSMSSEEFLAANDRFNAWFERLCNGQ